MDLLLFISVAMTTRQACRQNHRIILSSSEGYISSDVTKEFGYGSVDCPWVIEAGSGQQISISQFNLDRSSDGAGGSQRSNRCQEFAQIREGKNERSLSCVGHNRINEVYRSKGQRLEVRFVNRNVLNSMSTYLLHYRGKSKY